MPIIREEKLTVKGSGKVSFEAAKRELLAAIEEERQEVLINGEKTRLAKTGVSYREFKDLVETVNLIPFKRGMRSQPTDLSGDE